MLWQLAAFAAASPARPTLGLIRLSDALSGTLGQASDWLRAGLAGPPPKLPSLGESTDWQMPGVPDPIAASFGIDSALLLDRLGQVSDARLLAAYRSQLPELADICERLLYSITQPPLDLFATLEPLLELLRVARPLMAWTFANQALELIRQAAAADQSRAGEVFAELRQRSSSRAASRQRLATARQAAESAKTEADRALAELSAYRVIVEGQLRPWTWALLRLAGAEGEMPLVAELRDRLAASDQPLHAYLAGSLLPALRNADAHEEAHFDQLRGRLAVGDQLIELSELQASSAQLAAIEAGLEMALAVARAQVPALAEAYALRPADPLTATEALFGVDVCSGPTVDA